ncbi:MAG: hypothetical protein E7616_01460 [Ruminococcaceae bacterium]|nr:hypothetical protein [Oscillospiraceae bacterium]
MKKLCAFLLATVTVLSLVSCGSGYSKKEVGKYITVTDYKNNLVSKEDFEETFEETLQSYKDSYCAAIEVAGETQVKDGHVVNATYTTLLEVIKVEEPIEITVGENTIVKGDRAGETTSATKTFDTSLIGLTIKDKATDITYTFSGEYGKDAEGKDPDEKYLRSKQVTVSVKITEIDGKTDAETKVAEGSKIKLTYTMTLKLTDFSGTKKDITIGETKLGDVVSLDDVLKELKTPKKEEKKEEDEHDDHDHDNSSSSTTTEATDYKLSFEKKDITLEGDKLDKFLAGKKVSVTGTVHTVKEIPEFTDALVKEKSNGTYETIKDLEKALTDSVAADLALNELVNKSKMKKDLPKGDVEDAYENIENNMKSYYAMFMGQTCLTDAELLSFMRTYGSYFGMSLPTTATVKEMCNYFAAQAAISVKQSMLMYYVAEAEGLEVTSSEYKAYVKEQAKASKMSKRDFVKNSGGKAAIKESMLFNEVSEFLRDQVKSQLSL